MNRTVGMTAAHGIQVGEDAVGHEGREGRGESRHGLQAGIKSLVSGEFVIAHAAAPETFAVQANVPVREVLAHEILYGARRGVGS